MQTSELSILTRNSDSGIVWTTAKSFYQISYKKFKKSPLICWPVSLRFLAWTKRETRIYKALACLSLGSIEPALIPRRHERAAEIEPSPSPAGIKTEVSLWKRISQMFFVHTAPEELKNAITTGQLGVVFEQNSVSFQLPWRNRSRKSPVASVFVLTKTAAFSKFPGLRSDFEKIRFCDGLVRVSGRLNL